MDEINQDEIQQEAIKKNNLKTLLKKYRYFLYGIAGVVSLFILTIAYLFLNTSNMNYELKTVNQLWQEKVEAQLVVAEGNQIVMTVPDNVISTELMLRLGALKTPAYFKIKNIRMDGASQRILLDAKWHGLPLPLCVEVVPVIEDQQLIFECGKVTIGENGIGFKASTAQALLKKLFNDPAPFAIDTTTLLDAPLIKLSDLSAIDGNYVATLEVNENTIQKEITKISQSANEELLELFKKSEDASENLAAEYIKDGNLLNDEAMGIIINDLLTGSELATNLLLLADYTVGDELLDTYSKYLKSVNKIQLAEAKKELLTAELIKLWDGIVNALHENYFTDGELYFNRGQPYSFSLQRYITLQQVVEEQGIEVPSGTLEKLSFCYDREKKSLLISYKLDASNYLLMNKESSGLMDAETYQADFIYANTGVSDFVQDYETWEAIEAEITTYFQTEKVFVRYMKADEQYAFVVASPDYDYQNYWVFAFEKDGDWKILEENINTIKELNEKHPQFNLETSTLEIETTSFYKLEDVMFPTIMEDLYNKKKINSMTEVEIVYCSYGNEFIDVLLSNGKEYVYKIIRMYLYNVYEKDEAVNFWGVVPDLITLQEIPQPTN